MAGNSQRRGAVRKSNKKGSTVGSGGQRRRGLEGKGPTPKAGDRPNHKAHKMAKAAEKRGGGRPPQRSPKKSAASSEVVAGRNSVVEALRAGVPVTTMYVAGRIDADDRVREAIKTATERSIPILETPRGELDRLTDGAVHQGLALQVPPYEYAHPSDLVDPETPGIPLLVALDGITDPRNLGAIIRSVAAFGHTPGHTLFELQSAGQSFVYVGDLTNVPALFARNPDWAVTFDMDAEAARRTRREVFQRIVANNAMVGGYHFPFPAFGRLAAQGNGYAFQPA